MCCCLCGVLFTSADIHLRIPGIAMHCNALRKWRSYPFTGNHAMASVNSTVCCGKSTSKNGLHHFSVMGRYIPYPIPPSPHPPNSEMTGVPATCSTKVQAVWSSNSRMNGGRTETEAPRRWLWAKLVTRELFELWGHDMFLQVSFWMLPVLILLQLLHV
jgi:hypothetical protein